MTQAQKLEFGRDVRARRSLLGMTGPELAASARLPKSSVSKIENGVCNPTASTLIHLARALACTFEVNRNRLILKTI